MSSHLPVSGSIKFRLRSAERPLTTLTLPVHHGGLGSSGLIPRLVRSSLDASVHPHRLEASPERQDRDGFAMKTLLLVYHSLTGGTRQMAEAAARGAQAQLDVEVRLLPAVKAQVADVLAADRYIVATPECLAAIAGLMKDFFDRTYYPVLERINGRPYAILICAGGDGQNAARQIARIATGWRLRAIAEPIIVCTHAQTPEANFAPKVITDDDLARCEELGAALAAGLAMGVF